MSRRRIFVMMSSGLVVLAGAYGLIHLSLTHTFVWLPDYLRNSPALEQQDRTIDIIYTMVDHWEPGGAAELVAPWMNTYRKLADRHVDADGVRLQHSWFYPIDQFRADEVDSLMALCRAGYGDIDVHLHHRDDDSASLRRRLRAGIDSLQAHGALVSPDGRTRFAFVHGNWALDNSRLEGTRNYCGVNDELSILLELGCYADFTFPALNQVAQPPLVNKIYYCRDVADRPKSYATGVLASVGVVPDPDQLMIFEGPLRIDWKNWQFFTHPNLEDGNVYWEIDTSLHRFEVWLRANVHVEGRPNWVFVRPFTHGCGLQTESGFDNILGKNMDHMLTEVEARYNDGARYRLHYMTAREAYNVAKAAEAGRDGDPNAYRNYRVQPYVYAPDPRPAAAGSSPARPGK